MIDARKQFPIPTTDFTGQAAADLCARIPLAQLAHDDEVVLSLQLVRQFDTGGIAALVTMLARAQVAGLRLTLVDVPAALQHHLDTLRMADAFNCHGASAPAWALQSA